MNGYDENKSRVMTRLIIIPLFDSAFKKAFTIRTTTYTQIHFCGSMDGAYIGPSIHVSLARFCDPGWIRYTVQTAESVLIPLFVLHPILPSSSPHGHPFLALSISTISSRATILLELWSIVAIWSIGRPCH